jgi:hypothetical protein
MFFLISYGLLNYATYFEARSASPSFRPRFRYFNKWLSLAGGLACLSAMLAIDPAAGIIAIAFLIAIFQYLRQTMGIQRWADSQRDHHIQKIREHLLAAEDHPEHPRNWRPQILAFSEDPGRRSQLLEFSSWIEGRSGLTTLVKVIEGDGLIMRRQKAEAEAELRQHIANHSAKAFPLVLIAPDIASGIKSLVQSYGIASLKANTILLNWRGHSPKKIIGLGDQEYGINLLAGYLQGCNIVVLEAKPDKWDALEDAAPEDLRIDVWWWDDPTGRLMLLLAYLMTRSSKWRAARIRLLAVATGSESDPTIESLQSMLDDIRIEAQPVVIENPDADAIVQNSEDSALVFLPFRISAKRVVDPFGGSMDELLFLLPVVAMVLAAEDIELGAEPEEGKAAEMAAMLDTVEDAKKNANKAAKQAAKAEESAERAREKLEELNPQLTEEEKARVEKEARAAEKKAAKADRKAKKAEAKAQLAEEEAKAAGVLPSDENGEDSGEKK